MAEIAISKNEYELLVRDSERERVIERIMLNNVFISDDDIKAILGLPLPKKEVKSE